MEVLYTPIAIDLITPNPLPVLKAKQGDTARGALITLTAGSALTLTDETVRVFIKKPDGHIVYADCEIENGKVKAAYSYQMVAAAGKAELEIEIDDGSSRLSTPIAILQVMPSNISEAAEPSTSEAPALAGLIGTASTDTAGLVKVDGETITADPDGTLRVIGGGSGGGTGENGGYYTPEISQTEEQAAAGTMTVSYTASKDGMEAVEEQTVQLPAGKNGKSPTVSVDSIEGGHRITIIDAEKSTSFDVMDGGDGDDGVGIASVKQTETSSEDGGNNVLTITLTNGTTATFTVKNGSKGNPGVGVKSVVQTTTSTEDSGSNIVTVTMTDGSTATFTVKNGSKGGTGATPQISAGTVTTLVAGSNATASIGGTAEKPVINFGIPRGATGSTPQLSIGTVTTLAAGSNATASLGGTAESPVLNLGIPKGETATTPQAVVDGASALVDKALSRGTENVLRFVTWSDAHQKNDDTNITAGNKELGMAIGETLNRMGVDFVSNLGDSAWAAYANTTEQVREQLKTFNSFIRPHVRGEQELNCEGNHDDANYSTVDTDGDGVSASTEKLSLAETFALIYANNRDVVYDPNHAIDGYCYKDFDYLKTRVICLNTEQGTGDGGVVAGYQLKWFAETALNMTGKTDWNVVTLAHHPLDWGNGSLFKDSANIVDAFVNGTNFSYTTTDGTAITMNYSGKTCQYIGHFHGHTHAFCIIRMQKYVSGNYVDIKAWQIGIPNACYSRNNGNLGNTNERIARFSTPTTYNKSAVDGQRTSFNLVSVDLDNKIIYADNYGAGIDRQVAYTFVATVYTIANTLTNCSTSNTAESIEENSSYSATITPTDGYRMSSITVTMGGADITASAVSGSAINIGNVTGNIVITATAEAIPAEPTYTNQLPISTDADGNIYNGTGYKVGAKVGSTSGEDQNQSGVNLTGYMPFGTGSSASAFGEQVVRIANAELTTSNSNNRFGLYDSAKNKVVVIMANKLGNGATVDGVNIPYETDENGYITSVDLTQITYNRYKNTNSEPTAFIRVSGAGIDSDTIITVNEEIV